VGIRQTRDGVDLSRLGESHHLPALNAVVLGAGRSLLEDGYYAVSCVWTRSWCRGPSVEAPLRSVKAPLRHGLHCTTEIPGATNWLISARV